MIEVRSRRNTRTDYWLLLVVLALVVIGLVMVYSASYHFPLVVERYRDQPTHYFLGRQVIFALVGLTGLVVLSRVDYQVYRRLAIPILVGTVAILLVMAFVGRFLLEKMGSVQPSELAKMGAMIYMAVWLASKGEEIRQFSLGLVPFVLLLALMATLIVVQPDFSTAAILVATASAMLFVAGADAKQLVAYLLFVSAALVIAVVTSDYRRARVFGGWGPLSSGEAAGARFQEVQALIAFVEGGVFGVGLGQRGQKLILYAPHSDGVFAIIGEELGFVGAAFVIFLYVLWTWRGLRIAWHAEDVYGRLLAVGIVSWVTFQAALHIASLTDVTPLTGTVLPFVSSGGSSLITGLASVGILLSVARGSRSAEGTQPP